MKKLFAVFICISVIFSLFAVLSSAEGQAAADGVFYSNDSTVLVSCSDSFKAASFTVPETVTEISDGAFIGNKTVKTVIFPKSLKEIGKDAFYQSALVTADLRSCSNLTRIGDCAFLGCKSLKSVYLPASAVTLGESLFKDCVSLTELTLPETLYPSSMLAGCTSIQKVTVVKTDGTETVYYTGKAEASEGAVTASDARTALRVAAGLEPNLKNTGLWADVNRDGKITAADARTILRAAAKLETF